MKPSPSRPALMVLMGVALAASSLFAQTAPETGVLKGTVLSDAGSPIAKIAVKIYIEQERQTVGSDNPTKSTDFLPEPSMLRKSVLFKTVLTDANGKFEIKDLKPRQYIYRVGDPMTVGFKYGRTDVEKGKTTEVEIKLDPPKKPG